MFLTRVLASRPKIIEALKFDSVVSIRKFRKVKVKVSRPNCAREAIIEKSSVVSKHLIAVKSSNHPP